jgi:hypothetical protein
VRSASVDCYFSCTRETKLDKNTFEPELEAAAPADLLRQEPHVEVVDSRSSVDLSDEERLAAGVSTTIQQTKRLSGAQRKRLTRERKMKEGTWTDKPPRKTPSSQEMGAVGSSGGLKRPHSDSNTPSSEKQQPKKPRNTQWKLGRTRKLLLASRWRLFIDVSLISNWIRLRMT